MPRQTLAEFKETAEYKLWLNIEQTMNSYELSGDNYITRTDIGGYFWEPLWDKIYKLGVMLKHCPKFIKGIKGEWMRPLLYLEAQSQDIVQFDGVKYKIDKTANASATSTRFALKRLLDSLGKASKITDDSFQKDLKQLKEDNRYFFKNLGAYVKDGYRAMHENIKKILEPLRLLRKGGYRLFSYEQREGMNVDLNMFKEKDKLNMFLSNIKEQFKLEEILQAKNNAKEDLEKVLNIETNQNLLRYDFNPEKIVKKEVKDNAYAAIAYNKEIKKKETRKEGVEAARAKIEAQKKAEQEKIKRELHNLVMPNIDNLTHPTPNIFEKEALIKDFEIGFDAMQVYLNDKLPLQIPEVFDSHKITVNVDNIPVQYKATKHYMTQINQELYNLKRMCYEMKLNGLTRVLIPITNNLEFTTQVKKVYDLHVAIDKILGDQLKLEQFLFVYDNLEFVYKSNMKDQISIIKEKNFIEDSINKYLYFQAMCHSVNVLTKMRANNLANELKYDDISSYFQLTQLSLDAITCYNSDNYYNYNGYQSSNLKAYSAAALKQAEQEKIIYQKEIKKYGRFFLFENFISPDMKDTWVTLCNQLIEINDLVKENIRDYLLNLYRFNNNNKEADMNQSMDVSESDLSKSKISNKNLFKNLNPKKTNSRKNSIAKKMKKGSKSASKQGSRAPSAKKRRRKESTTSSIYGDSDTEEEVHIKHKNFNLQKLKPPYVWNFPIKRLKDVNKKKDKAFDNIECDYIDFNDVYKDGRIQKFLEPFFEMVEKNLEYCREKMGNNWEYFINKELEILGIHYPPYADKFYRKVNMKILLPGQNENEEELKPEF